MGVLEEAHTNRSRRCLATLHKECGKPPALPGDCEAFISISTRLSHGKDDSRLVEVDSTYDR